MNDMSYQLGSDPVTAYRLAKQDDGTVRLAEMLKVWNAISPLRRHELKDLPSHMQRDGEFVVSDEDHEKIRLEPDQLIEETFRLSALRHSIAEKGWHNASNLARIAKVIGRHSGLQKKKSGSKFISMLRDHSMIESTMIGDVLYLRPRITGPRVLPSPVKTTISLPTDEEDRQLPEKESFGAAYRVIHQMGTALVAHGTRLTFTRDGETKKATYDAKREAWMFDDGSRMKRTDPSDPVMHHYANGHLVGGVIGFISVNSSGRVYGNIGTVIDSHDEDAFINVFERKEFEDIHEAEVALRERSELDHVFAKPIMPNSMGFWLSGMED